MGRKTDYPNRAFNPALVPNVSSTEVGVQLPRCHYLNPSSENMTNTDTHERHQYEDLPQLWSRMSNANRLESTATGSCPRRKRNEVYESTSDLSPLKKTFFRSRHTDTECSEHSVDTNGPRDWCMSRLILFLVLVVSITSLLLVIFMMLGIVDPGTKCAGCNRETGEGSASAVRGEENIPNKGKNFEKIIVELMQNVSALQTSLVSKDKRIVELKTRLAAQDKKIADFNVTSKIVKNTTVGDSWVPFIQAQQDIRSSLKKLNVTVSRLQSEKRRVVEQLSWTDGYLNKTVKKLHEEDSKIESSLQTKLDNITKNIKDLEQKYFNVSLVTGSRGPRGINGSQGPEGPRGVGDLSKCIYKDSSNSSTKVSLPVPANEVIMGVTCSASPDTTKTYNQLSYKGSENKYTCTCTSSEDGYDCVLKYWSCPKLS